MRIDSPAGLPEGPPAVALVGEEDATFIGAAALQRFQSRSAGRTHKGRGPVRHHGTPALGLIRNLKVQPISRHHTCNGIALWTPATDMYFIAGAVPESAPQDTPDRKRKIESRESPLVLIADDEPIIAETLVDILTGEGFNAVAVSDGAHAVESAKELKPDILLADVSMPRLNGIEAAKQILEFLPQLRILLFSGQAETTQLLANADHEGFDFEVLAKPLNPHALLSKLRSRPL